MTTTVNAYLSFNGNCEEAFNFYQSVFGGTIPYVSRYSDMPAEEGQPEIPASEKNKVLHMSLPISKETILFGADSSEAFGGAAHAGNNITLCINTETKEEADRLFQGLSRDGKVTMPMDDTFWGAYFGMFTDKFGINWMVNAELKKQ